MSGSSPAGHGHHHGHGHHDDGAPHGSRRGYMIGFLLSVVLTAIPFALVMTGAIADTGLVLAIVTAAALVQIVVHMVYFLHMNRKAEGGWTLMALGFTAILVVIAISGSIWVMYNMNANMMPGMSGANARAMDGRPAMNGDAATGGGM